MIHGKISLAARKVEVTLLLGPSPNALKASLRLLIANAKVKTRGVVGGDKGGWRRGGVVY